MVNETRFNAISQLNFASLVGPVLQTSSPLTDAIVQAIRVDNTGVTTQDRGSYLRIMSPGRCALNVKRVEEFLGRPFHLPSDLESVMASFKGKMTFHDDSVTWTSDGGALP